jgi:hypothetical protein
LANLSRAGFEATQAAGVGSTPARFTRGLVNFQLPHRGQYSVAVDINRLIDACEDLFDLVIELSMALLSMMT